MDIEPPSQIAFLLLNSSIFGLSGLCCLLILLFLSALISGSEVAYFSIKQKDLHNTDESAIENFNGIQKLLRNKKKLLATILVANNFINIGIVLLSSYLSKYYIHPALGETVFLGLDLSVIFDIVIITFILLLFGEIIPKIYAAKNPLFFANLTARPLGFAEVVTQPIALPLLWLSTKMEDQLSPGKTISVDQLSQALELTSQDETTSQDEQKILEGIVNFGNTDTSQIMTPRVDMFSLRSDTDFQEVIDLVSSNGFSRIPVYDEKIDEIKGILYAKDLLPFLPEVTYDWIQLLRKPFFVPVTKKLDDLLSDFQEKKIHLAIVVDEYGGTSGLVTLEDVLEEIVGDISDEFDDEDLCYSKLDNTSYVFEGKTSLKDFYRIMDIDNPDLFEEVKGEADTIAGFILEITEETPQNKEEIQFKNYKFIIEAIDKKRLRRIKVVQLPINDNNEDV